MQLHFIVGGVATPRPDEYGEKNKNLKEFSCAISAITVSVEALGWIRVSPGPVKFIQDMKDAHDYFGHHVLCTYKRSQKHQSFVDKWKDVMTALEEYVKKFHLTGFAWGSSSEATGSFETMAGGDDSYSARNQINQGVGITRMLQPVSRAQRSYFTSTVESLAPAASSSADQISVPTTSTRAEGSSEQTRWIHPPKCFLEGRIWRVEDQRENVSLVIENEKTSESLSMSRCENSGLTVKNKMTRVSIDNCKTTCIVVNSIISSVDMINCTDIVLECHGRVPLINIENCQSVRVYLNEESIDADVISSMSNSLKICLLSLDGDYTEFAIPEKIKSVVDGGRIVSTAVHRQI